MNDEKNENIEQDDVVFEEEGEGLLPAQKIKKLREELKKCQQEKEEYLAGWQRAKADFINLKREEEKNRLDLMKFANKELIMEILSVADSFDMAFVNKEAWEKVDQNWRTGVEYIYGQLVSILEQNGVKQLNPIGETFDPNVHTSIESVPAEKPEDDHKIVAVIQKGYMMHGFLVRSPKVRVGIMKHE
ncbi:MAG: nucleotide exchange factor GrpE [Parcubacteria group bacterium]|nr:nucleotide exchange factor GrpE [Parcubacteria group bacterium]